MIHEILKRIVGGRNTFEMSVSEARKIVADFYLAVEVATLGARNRQAIEYKCNRALQMYGLDLLA